MRNFAVSSVQRPGDSPQDGAHKMSMAQAVLNAGDMTYRVGRGAYKGVEEPCIRVDIRAGEDLAVVVALATAYEQESTLVVRGSDGKARLYFMGDVTTEPIDLGQWLEVSPEYAQRQEAWSAFKDPTGFEHFFVCEER